MSVFNVSRLAAEISMSFHGIVRYLAAAGLCLLACQPAPPPPPAPPVPVQKDTLQVGAVECAEILEGTDDRFQCVLERGKAVALEVRGPLGPGKLSLWLQAGEASPQPILEATLAGPTASWIGHWKVPENTPDLGVIEARFLAEKASAADAASRPGAGSQSDPAPVPPTVESVSHSGPPSAEQAREASQQVPGPTPASPAATPASGLATGRLPLVTRPGPRALARPHGLAATCFARHDARDLAGATEACANAWSGAADELLAVKLAAGMAWGYALRGQGRLDEAAKAYRQVADEASRQKAWRTRSRCLLVLSNILVTAGRPSEALQVLSQGLTDATRAGDQLGQLELTRMRGSTSLARASFSQAWQELDQALSLARQQQNGEQEAKCRLELAQLAIALGDPGTAFQHLSAAEGYYQALEAGLATPPRPSSLEDLATYFAHLARASSWNQRRGQATGATPPEALYQKAAALYHQAGSSLLAGRTLLRSADAALRQGNLSLARDRAQEALAGLPASEAADPFAQQLSGELSLAKGEARQALKAFQRLEAAGSEEPEARFLGAFGQARALSRLGKRREASGALDRALDQVQAMARGTDLWVSRAGFVGEREDLFRFAVGEALSARKVELAFARAEQSRLTDALAESAQARVSLLSQTQAAAWDQWRNTLDDLRKKATPDPTEAVLPAAERQARALARKAAREALETQAAAFSAWADAAQPLPALQAASVKEVQQALRPGEALLAYSATLEGLVAFLLTEKAVMVHKTGLSLSQAEEAVGRLREALITGREDWPLESAGLAQTLLGPLAGKLPSRRLLVVPYGALFRLPFSALILPDSAIFSAVQGKTRVKAAGNGADTPDRSGGNAAEGKPLLETLEIVYATSASAWMRRREGEGESGPQTPALLVVGDPLGDLPGARGEALAVAQLWPQARNLTGDQARLDAVLKALPEADVLHFSGHGVLEGPGMVGPRLLLAGRQGLTGLELLGLAPKARRVVLSGCETAGGQLMAGGELRGMVSAFLRGGARSVVASFWPMRDGEAAGSMVRFHRGWRDQKMSWSKALHESMLEARHGQDGKPGLPPRAWAAWAVWGDSDGD